MDDAEQRDAIVPNVREMSAETITTPTGFSATFHWNDHDEDDAHLLATGDNGRGEVALRLEFHAQHTGHYASVEVDPETLAMALELAIEVWDDEMAAGYPREITPRAGWSMLVMARQRAYVVDDREYVRLAWELAPLEEERPADPPDEAVVSLRMGIIELESRIGSMPAELSDLAAVDDACFDWRQRYGPLTPWVVSNARVFVDCVESDALASRAQEAAATEDWRVLDMVLHTLSRDFRRERAVVEIAELAGRLVDERERRPSWRADVRRHALELRMTVEESEEYLRLHLVRFVRISLSALALEDRLDERQRLPALGAWRTLLAPDECDAGPAWRCKDTTTLRLGELMKDWSEDHLVDALEAIESHSDPVQEELRMKLVGSTLTSSSAPPPPGEIVGPGLSEAVTFRGGRSMVDGFTRIIAGLSEPPRWIDQDDIDRQRRIFTELFGLTWDQSV